MLDDSMYPVDAVRLLAHTLRSTAFSWHDADHRLVEKFAEEMTMQDFIAAAEEQRDRILREHARMMAAFMNHDGAANQTTLGEILDRDQVIKGVSVAFMAALGVILAWGVLHSSYALHYAYLYYRSEESAGGLALLSEQNPDQLDFAYFAFTIATSFAGSDVDVTDRTIR